MQSVYVKNHFVKKIKRGYPWVFMHQLVGSAVDGIAKGEWISFCDEFGRFLGVGTFDREAEICGRIISSRYGQVADILPVHLHQARIRREKHFERPFYRWVYSEADYLGGLVIDRMGDYVSVQINTQGMWLCREEILQAIISDISPKGVVIRSGSRGARREGLPNHQITWGNIPQAIPVWEDERLYFTSILAGQKTGWYFDQRVNHRQVEKWASQGQKVLDVFSYQGGFGFAAAKSGADVVMVDCSQAAIEMSQKTFAHHGLAAKWHQADAWDFLSSCQDKYDMVIIDPPALVTDKSHFHSAKSAYLSLLDKGFQCVLPGGILVFASCSSHVDKKHMRSWAEKILHKHGLQGEVIYQFGHDHDHPVLSALPSMRYLECVAWRIL